MGFPNIAIILRILLGFFQVFYAIFWDFLGFWDLVRFWDFSKDLFFTPLTKCAYVFHGNLLSTSFAKQSCSCVEVVEVWWMSSDVIIRWSSIKLFSMMVPFISQVPIVRTPLPEYFGWFLLHLGRLLSIIKHLNESTYRRVLMGYIVSRDSLNFGYRQSWKH